MIKVYQDKTVENDGFGNCFNACVASLLELPLRNVASIYPNTPGDWMEQWRVWLADKGYKLGYRGLKDPPSGYGIATVYTERVYPEGHKKAGAFISHAVLCWGDTIIHDPYPLPALRYEMKYYQILKPLCVAEKHLHQIRAEKGRCVHGYRSLCNECDPLVA